MTNTPALVFAVLSTSSELTNSQCLFAPPIVVMAAQGDVVSALVAAGGGAVVAHAAGNAADGSIHIHFRMIIVGFVERMLTSLWARDAMKSQCQGHFALIATDLATRYDACAFKLKSSIIRYLSTSVFVVYFLSSRSCRLRAVGLINIWQSHM